MIKRLDRLTEKVGIVTKKEINLGLDRILHFLESIGNPQNELKAIHIAGTNGKGSTLQFLRQILMEAGYSVGTFTSPHIVKVNDQISTNKGFISDEDLENTLRYLKTEAGENSEGLTEFELLTVLAIVYFSRFNPQDIVIFETGMGGLTDSTNVLKSILTIITTISIEHTAFLGNTLEEISYQKAGIIKKGIPCITGVKDQAALGVIKKYAGDSEAKLYVINEDFKIINQSVETMKNRYSPLIFGLKGEHQKENASLAIVAAEVLKYNYDLKIEMKHIVAGVKKTFWPGRFEVISNYPVIVLDGAHNPDAMNRLVETVKQEYPNLEYHFIFGALHDKNTKQMIETIEQIANKMTFVDFPFLRAASADMLASQSTLENKTLYLDLKTCLTTELRNTNKDKIMIITGSLYLISEVKMIVEELNL